MFEGLDGSEFVGAANYIDVFHDEYFQAGLMNNLKILFIAVPVLLILALILASVLNTAVFGTRGVKGSLFYAIYHNWSRLRAIVFAALFHEEFGPVNEILQCDWNSQSAQMACKCRLVDTNDCNLLGLEDARVLYDYLSCRTAGYIQIIL